MKNKIIKTTTKVAAVIAVSSVIMGTSSVTARADDLPVTGEEVAPAVLRTDLELEYSPTVENEQYDPVISGVVVAPAPMRTDLEMEYNVLADPSAEYAVSTGMVVAPPVFRPEPESEYAAMLEKENMRDDSIIRGEEVSQALVRTSDGEFVIPATPEPVPEVTETPIEEEEYIRNKKIKYATHKPVNQYDIKPGKYYDLFESNLVDNDRIRVIYVKRVFEDPRWYGSERMVEFIDCQTGKTEQMQVNRFFGGNYFYEEIEK